MVPDFPGSVDPDDLLVHGVCSFFSMESYPKKKEELRERCIQFNEQNGIDI